MNTRKNNTFLRTMAVIAGMGLFLLGGIGVTGAAARASIPGDALYPVKTTLEQARLSLAQDAGDRAQMKMAFAAQRLEELDALVREGRYREIRNAVVAFETDINSALLELETVSQADPARASVIAGEVAAALSRYAQILSDLAAVAPEAVRGEFNRALDTTQLTGGLNQTNVNANDDNSNGNANDDNGNDDNSNANANDDNGNDDNNNANTNDDNGNDDNSNANANTNDDNGNDDNSNANANDDNGNDDNGNANASDDNANDDNGNDDDNSGSGKGGDDDGGDDDNSGSGKGGDDDSGKDDRSGKDDKGSDDKSDD